jgi:formamidopyrimidine-DNA glycosylase
MPELPEVETFKRYLDATALHQEIEKVEIRSELLLEDTRVQELQDTLQGRSFRSTRRHGKYLFVELEGDGWLVLHFGMSGRLKYFRDMTQDPPYDRFLVTFGNGYHLAYDAARKLGEIEVIHDWEAFIEEKELGPDVLDPDFDLETFLEILEQRRGMIKPALMDQQLMAGIGNVYSDEILFQAHIHPRTKIDQLDEKTRTVIDCIVQEVLRTAIEHQATPDEFPDSYLIPHRDPEGMCPLCGGEIERVKVSGCTAYYCPNRQGKDPRERS